MAHHPLPLELLDIIAGRFKALAEPARLQLLSELHNGERTVTQLVEATGMGQANVSKHLTLLHAMGFVTRRRHGAFVVYALADRDVFRLCDIMCGRLEAELAARSQALGPANRSRPRTRGAAAEGRRKTG